MSRPAALALCAELGVTAAMLRERALPFHREARSLVPVGLGTDGRDKLLGASAARAWPAMQQAAARDGISLLLISAFRSYAFQAALIRQKLDKGHSLADTPRRQASPGSGAPFPDSTRRRVHRLADDSRAMPSRAHTLLQVRAATRAALTACKYATCTATQGPAATCKHGQRLWSNLGVAGLL